MANDKNERWKAYEPKKVRPDERQAELKNFASTIPKKPEKSNSRVLPRIQKGGVPDRKSTTIPIVAKNNRHAQPKVTVSPPKVQERTKAKSGPLPKIFHANPKGSEKRIMNYIYDPNRPENTPKARKKEMSGRSFANQQEEAPQKMVVKWHPHRRNPDHGGSIQVELEDCILDGLPSDVAHESEPLSKVILTLLAEILTLRDRIEHLEQRGAAAAPPQAAGTATDFASGEMARAMQAAAERAIRAQQQENQGASEG